MNCVDCHFEFIDGERITASVKETFIFKPADVPDVKMYEPDGNGRVREINAAAVLSPEALAASRKDHMRTAVATIYATVGKASLPEGAYNPRHLYCGVLRTGAASNGAHPLVKHSIRYARSQRRAGGQY